jgi:hypothetical protein
MQLQFMDNAAKMPENDLIRKAVFLSKKVSESDAKISFLITI